MIQVLNLIKKKKKVLELQNTGLNFVNLSQL
jgi:hypothetical protein